MSKRTALITLLIGLALLGTSVGALVWSGDDDAGDAGAIEELVRSAVASDAGSTSPDTLENAPGAAEDSATVPEEDLVRASDDRTAPEGDEGYQPPDLTIEPGPAPVGLRIEELDVDAPVGAYGVNRRSGEMEVPDNVTDVGWYRFGPSPGEDGSSVLAAHVDLARQGPGVFFNLRKLEPGTLIVVDMDDGSERFFRAHARKTYDKDELPLDVIFAKEGPPILTLITCGGGFNRSIGSYDSNVVVYAVPVDGPDDPGDFAI